MLVKRVHIFCYYHNDLFEMLLGILTDLWPCYVLRYVYVDDAKLLLDCPVDILVYTVVLKPAVSCWYIWICKGFISYHPSIVRIQMIVQGVRLGKKLGPDMSLSAK